ncbi:MAG: hypothetical protein EA348_11070 [Pseudomonadaceae bacterium]|nr:MAG: hypothetical protein EA348_11070 [Pseudomonadaceae bacterium]
MKKVTAMTCVLFAGAGLFISQVAIAEPVAQVSYQTPLAADTAALQIAENGLERFRDFIRPDVDDAGLADTASS